MNNPKNTLFNLLAIMSILLSVLATPTAGGLVLAQDGTVTRYVKPGLTGDCAAWATACDLGAALAQSTSGDEIWAAEGTYYPDPTGLTDPREATFQLKSGVALYGGFAGTETALDQRDPGAHLTTLSGDLDQNSILDDGNAYHVVTGSGTDASAILDGFTVTAGVASGAYPYIDGGGMYIKTGSPTLTNVAFSSNSATDLGGGMYNEGSSPTLTNVTFTANSAPGGAGMDNEESSPTLTNVTFSGNTAVDGGGGMANYASSPILTHVTFSGNSAASGGGMYSYINSNPNLTDVTFSANTAVSDGGGMLNTINSSPILTNVTFSANTAYYDGGGMNNYESSPTLTNVTFSNNSSNYGGGMINAASNPTLTNVTFSANSAPSGGGMYNTGSSPTLTDVTFSGNSAEGGGGMFNFYSSSPTLTNVTFYANLASVRGGGMGNSESSHPVLVNTILWGNTPQQIYNGVTSSPAITYSDVQGGWSATGNLDADPLLGPLADNGGFTLTHDLLMGSPAIDAGSPDSAACPATDQRGVHRPIDGDGINGARCDMGAVEYLPKAAFLPLVRR